MSLCTSRLAFQLHVVLTETIARLIYASIAHTCMPYRTATITSFNRNWSTDLELEEQ